MDTTLTETIKTAGITTVVPGAAASPNGEAAEVSIANDSEWHPDAHGAADKQSEVKLQELVKAHERANQALNRERQQLQKRLVFQRKLITHLRNKVNAKDTQASGGWRLVRNNELQDTDSRFNRVKSLNNALLRIGGVEAPVEEATLQSAKIDKEEFLPIPDPVVRTWQLNSCFINLHSMVLERLRGFMEAKTIG